MYTISQVLPTTSQKKENNFFLAKNTFRKYVNQPPFSTVRLSTSGAKASHFNVRFYIYIERERNCRWSKNLRNDRGRRRRRRDTSAPIDSPRIFDGTGNDKSPGRDHGGFNRTKGREIVYVINWYEFKGYELRLSKRDIILSRRITAPRRLW